MSQDNPNVLPQPGDTIKAITLYEPWASLMALGEKAVETRSWGARHRGWTAIHAGRSFTAAMKQVCLSRAFIKPLTDAGLLVSATGMVGGRIMIDHRFPLGKVVALGYLEASISVRSDLVRGILASRPAEVHYGNYEPGRFAHLYSVVVPLSVPIEARGLQGFWDWTIPDGVAIRPHDARWR
jgi:hypothetical protein